jgi:uncharacterized repeat protein (TIGR01451 family)
VFNSTISNNGAFVTSRTPAVDHATANLSDTLTYTVAVQNTGQGGATGTTFTDPIPTGVVFVPGSIRVNGAAVTDAAGDDLGEFAGGQVVARLGTSITPSQGSCSGTNCNLGTITPGPGAGHDRRDGHPARVRYLSLGRADEQHRDRLDAGRGGDQTLTTTARRRRSRRYRGPRPGSRRRSHPRSRWRGAR